MPNNKYSKTPYQGCSNSNARGCDAYVELCKWFYSWARGGIKPHCLSFKGACSEISSRRSMFGQWLCRKKICKLKLVQLYRTLKKKSFKGKNLQNQNVTILLVLGMFSFPMRTLVGFFVNLMAIVKYLWTLYLHTSKLFDQNATPNIFEMSSSRKISQ